VASEAIPVAGETRWQEAMPPGEVAEESAPDAAGEAAETAAVPAAEAPEKKTRKSRPTRGTKNKARKTPARRKPKESEA
jgi:hypothetical protein